jgi:hypothetical protein
MADCEINGCPKIGHIKVEGHWNCRYHYAARTERLVPITLALKNYSMDFDWYETLLNLNTVDFYFGYVARLAPFGFEVLPTDTIQSYKLRVKAKIDGLLTR